MIFCTRLHLNNKKNLLRILQEKVTQLEQLIPLPANLEKPEEEKVRTMKIEMEKANYEVQVEDSLTHGKGNKNIIQNALKNISQFSN